MEILNKFKIRDLKKYLKTFSLKVSGNKSSLISRLTEFFNGHPQIYQKYIVNKYDLDLFSKNELYCNIIQHTSYNSKNSMLSYEELLTYKYIYKLGCNINNKYILSKDIQDKIYRDFQHYKLDKYSLDNKTYIECHDNYFNQFKKALFDSSNILVQESVPNDLNQLILFHSMLKYYRSRNFMGYIYKIQKVYRNYINKKRALLRGPAFNNIKLSVNDEDFLTFEDLSEIDNNLFYSFIDKDKRIYSFNINSLKIHIDDCKRRTKRPFNPYNNLDLSDDILNNFDILENLVNKNTKKHKIVFNDKKQFIYAKALDTFQKMDMLNNYTDVMWFLNLNIHKLKKLYAHAEDIWAYRAMHLTHDIRLKHIPNNDAFTVSVQDVYNMISKFKIQNMILDEFHKFITEGETIEERKTGALWMLTALVQVSPDAAQSYPWLIHVD